MNSEIELFNLKIVRNITKYKESTISKFVRYSIWYTYNDLKIVKIHILNRSKYTFKCIC